MKLTAVKEYTLDTDTWDEVHIDYLGDDYYFENNQWLKVEEDDSESVITDISHIEALNNELKKHLEWCIWNDIEEEVEVDWELKWEL